MAEYRITSIKKGDQWTSDYGTFQSYALALNGIGEPVQLNKKVPVKQEPAVGDVLHGTLEEKTSKTGRPYYKFKAENNYQPKGKNGYDSDGMAWGNSLTNAVSIVTSSSKTGDDAYSQARDALEIAKLFYEARPGHSAEVVTETTKATENVNRAFGSTDVVAEVPEEEIDISSIPF